MYTNATAAATWVRQCHGQTHVHHHSHGHTCANATAVQVCSHHGCGNMCTSATAICGLTPQRHQHPGHMHVHHHGCRHACARTRAAATRGRQHHSHDRPHFKILFKNKPTKKTSKGAGEPGAGGKARGAGGVAGGRYKTRNLWRFKKKKIKQLKKLTVQNAGGGQLGGQQGRGDCSGPFALRGSKAGGLCIAPPVPWTGRGCPGPCWGLLQGGHMLPPLHPVDLRPVTILALAATRWPKTRGGQRGQCHPPAGCLGGKGVR